MDAAGQRVQLILGDVPRVGLIGSQAVDRHLLDGEGREALVIEVA